MAVSVPQSRLTLHVRHGSVLVVRPLMHSMTPTSNEPRIIEWARYPAALVMVFLVSVATLFMSGAFCQALPRLAISDIFAFVSSSIVAFMGVFCGSFCFRHAKRPFGSVFLLMFGLGFYVCFMAREDILRGDPFHFPFGGFVMLAIGGGAAVGLQYWLRPNTAPEPTVAAPSASDTPSNLEAGGDSMSASGDGGSALDR